MEKKRFAVVGRQIVFYHTKQEDRPILDSLDINIRKGHIYGLLGPSGCGKTTLLRCILGRLQLKSGYIWVYGRTPGEPNFFIPGKGVGYMPQEIALCSTITVEEILWQFGQLYRMDYRHIERRVAFLVDLLNIPSKDVPVYKLSEGQKRRVSFAAALIHEPPLLILDEPTVGVDPVLRQTIWDYLNLIAFKTDTTVIITTHYVEEARNAHKVGLMGNGRLLAEKNPAKLIKMHQARTLEDVFLKLTIANDEWSDVSSAMEKASSTKVDKSYPTASSAETIELLRDESERDYSPDFSKVSEKSSLKKHADLGALKDYGNPVNAYGTYSPAQKFVNSLSRIGTLIKKSFIESRRNIPLLTLRISTCAIQLIMYSIAIQTFTNVSLAVVNANSENTYSSKFLEKLDIFTQISYCNLSSAKESVRQGKTKGVLYIQPNFMPNTRDRLFRQNVSNYTHENNTASGSPIQLFLDMTDQQLSSAIKSKVENGLNDFMEDELKIGEQYSPIVVGKAIYGSRDATYRDFLIINLQIGVLYNVGVSMTAVSIIPERREGFIERLLVAGVTYFEILVSILFSMMIIMALEVALSVMTIVYIIQIPIHGSVLWLSIASLLAGVCSLTLGLLFATTSDNVFMALLITLCINSPISVFSGILWHKASMPSGLKSISYLFPITTLVETSNDIVSRGWSLMEHQTFWKILVPFGWIVFPLCLAMVIDKYKNR